MPITFDECLQEIGMFFEGTSAVHQTMNRVCAALESLGITYAVVGGMAVNAHGHRRTTDDVDFLLRPEDLTTFRSHSAEFGFTQVPQRPRRFLDTATDVSFDLLVTGQFPGSGAPGPVAFPDPAVVREIIQQRWVLNLTALIRLKLAARRHQDFADVVNLIRVHNLSEAFMSELHPTLHADFIECLEEKRREDEYEARADQAFLDLL
jgi:hypothetical protein